MILLRLDSLILIFQESLNKQIIIFLTKIIKNLHLLLIGYWFIRFHLKIKILEALINAQKFIF